MDVNSRGRENVTYPQRRASLTGTELPTSALNPGLPGALAWALHPEADLPFPWFVATLRGSETLDA